MSSFIGYLHRVYFTKYKKKYLYGEQNIYPRVMYDDVQGGEYNEKESNK